MNNHIVEEWVANKGLSRHIFFQKYPLDDRVMRLFAVACCQEAWNELTDERSRKSVEVAELYADGLVGRKELYKAYNDAWDYYHNNSATRTTVAAYAYASAAFVAHYSATCVYCTSDSVVTSQQQGIILAQMYPVPFNNNYINPTTKTLAQQIYDNKDFSLIPILADALQDVDCNEEILNHLRGTGPFYKGNYVIDRLIGKRS